MNDYMSTIHIQAPSLTSTQVPVVTHSITIHKDLTWTETVHAHAVDNKKSPTMSAIQMNSRPLQAFLEWSGPEMGMAIIILLMLFSNFLNLY